MNCFERVLNGYRNKNVKKKQKLFSWLWSWYYDKCLHFMLNILDYKDVVTIENGPSPGDFFFVLGKILRLYI